MSKAKQSNPSANHEATPAEHEHKGFLNLAGEAFVVLGEEIVEGKDKVIEVVGEKFTNIKSAISNLTHKKKKAAPKKAVKKAVKKVAKKAVKKAAKKAAPVKKAVKKLVKKAVAVKKKAVPAKKKAVAAKKKAAPAKKKAAPKKASKGKR